MHPPSAQTHILEIISIIWKSLFMRRRALNNSIWSSRHEPGSIVAFRPYTDNNNNNNKYEPCTHTSINLLPYTQNCAHDITPVCNVSLSLSIMWLTYYRIDLLYENRVNRFAPTVNVLGNVCLFVYKCVRVCMRARVALLQGQLVASSTKFTCGLAR